MSTEVRRILVTSALPYANGDIHIGHLVEYLQTDFWVRFQKMRGHECRYICADDTHGTPIMIAARKRGITPEELIAEARRAHMEDFTAFEVAFDHFGSTNSPANRELSEFIFQRLEEQGHVEARPISQLYCEKDAMFLPDRFVKGHCPKCGAVDQYGDSCDACGTTYAPTDLVDARCSICDTPPVSRESTHLFVKLNNFREFLAEWVPEHTQTEIAKKLQEWIGGELRDWDISRDRPYFGFEIPGYPDKFFYVWVDAPIGYIASTSEWCKANNLDLDTYWRSGQTEIYHFIGKDIVYFHALFWPAMLKAAGFTLPHMVCVHGFLRVNGEKMSKSKGTFINAKTFYKHINPLYLRYYYACKLSNSVADVDLHFDDFVGRVNSDLIGKITNVASRGFQMLQKKLDGCLGAVPEDGHALLENARNQAAPIAEHYENRDFSRALLLIRDIADATNKYFDDREPWRLVKQDPKQVRGILTTILNAFRIMTVYLKPILPSYAARVETLFGEAPFNWNSAMDVVENKACAKFEHLIQRICPHSIDSVVEESRQAAAAAIRPSSPLDAQPIEPEISIDEFKKVDMRVARVVAADAVEGADKLLRLTLDLGGEERTVFAGIKKSYKPEDLLDRHVIVAANLKPRKMRFGLSQGMVLAVPDETGVRLLHPAEGAQPGSRVS